MCPNVRFRGHVAAIIAGREHVTVGVSFCLLSSREFNLSRCSGCAYELRAFLVVAPSLQRIASVRVNAPNASLPAVAFTVSFIFRTHVANVSTSVVPYRPRSRSDLLLSQVSCQRVSGPITFMSSQGSEFTAAYKRIAILGAEKILRNLATPLLFLFCPDCLYSLPSAASPFSCCQAAIVY